jgi:hypothetical protein
MDSPAHLNHPVHLNKATYLRIQLGITAEETENFGTRGILQYCVSHGQRQGSLALFHLDRRMFDYSLVYVRL